ncbi:MAG: hypothetical protein C0401_07335 [Anaerolinea sp.]|nr:hypothetical protein [Anaerolinea sp.]
MAKYLSPKCAPDGRTLLNLGCGTRMHPVWNNLDFSIHARLRRHMLLVKLFHRVGLISPIRFAQFSQVEPDIIVWDLRHGIPFDDGSFDVVYHSHLLEHIDREAVPGFLRECRRVLKPCGTLRIVVPDLEIWAHHYVFSLQSVKREGIESHNLFVAALLDQIVRREPKTRDFQKPIVRTLERIFLGDALATGYNYRWMYDFWTLMAILEQTGFVDARRESASTSRIEKWMGFGLDTNPDGSEHKPGSLYCEATKSV